MKRQAMVHKIMNKKNKDNTTRIPFKAGIVLDGQADPSPLVALIILLSKATYIILKIVLKSIKHGNIIK